ncbi:MAG TPA: CvpA family protein [Dehalococcoidia bacterium]|nr:CvpA family protein [Dehalococcoidia bacterium]
MNWLDALIIAVLLGFTLSAYSAGLIREVVTLVAVVVGVVAAGLLYDDLAQDVLVFINDKDVAFAVAFLMLFGGVYLLGQTTAIVLKRTASLLMLGWADHLGGAAFGLLKGLIIVEALLILFAAYPQLGVEKDIDGSALAPAFLDHVPVLLHLLPGEFQDRVDRFLSPQPG